MQYPTTRHWLPLTPPEDYDDPLRLIQPFADLSLDLGTTNSSTWVPPFSPVHHHLPSYDPMSPSYDPCASSPCNPFPTSSPFATFTFTRPKTSSNLGLEDSYTSETAEPCMALLPHPIPHTPPRPLSRAAALSRIPPPHSAPSLRRTKPCRFYLDPAGCKSGRWCNFKHPAGARSEDRLCNENSTLAELRAAVIRSRTANNATNSDISVWDDVPDVRDLDPNWGKKGDDDVHPKWRTQPCRNFLLGLCRFGDKCQFIHAPGLFPTTTPDSYPSSLPLPVALEAPLRTSSPHSLPVPLSVWGPHPGIGVAAGADSPEGIMSAKSEQMSLFYRTKPCKYFEVDGSCPHGADCKFIHDPKKSTPSSIILDHSSPQHPSWADDDRELDLEDMPNFSETKDGVSKTETDDDVAMQDMTNECSRRSASMRRRDRSRAQIAIRDANKKAAQQGGGIFKPMWRVVGGGVMLASVERNFGNTKTDEDEDAVLDYQPRDLTTPIASAVTDDAQADSFFASHGAAASLPDVHDYDYAVFSVDPSQYPPNELLRPPSPNAQLEITMGKMDGWNLSPATQAPRKKRVVTGADLMRGIMGTKSEEDVSLRQTETKRTPSPRERQKPRLTIAVPTLEHTHRRTQSYGVRGSASYTPYPHYQPRRAEECKVTVCTDAGDDVLDWGEDGDDLESGGTAVGEAMDRSQIEAYRANGEEIRRAHSTPPTPHSGQSFLDVPIMPRLPAESP